MNQTPILPVVRKGGWGALRHDVLGETHAPEEHLDDEPVPKMRLPLGHDPVDGLMPHPLHPRHTRRRPAVDLGFEPFLGRLDMPDPERIVVPLLGFVISSEAHK